MLSLFKKKPDYSYNPEITYKQRVDRFWDWFEKRADYFDEGFNSQSLDADELAAEVSAKVSDAINSCAWCFGPAMDKNGHHLALSPEGNMHRLMLSNYWQTRAPQMHRWEFYAAKPGGDCTGRGLNIMNNKFDFEDIKVCLIPNEERHMPDLQVYHPLFKELDEDAPIRITFIALDETLGELGVESWLGAIDCVDELPEHYFGIEELNFRLQQLYEIMEWDFQLTGQKWTLYTFKSPDTTLSFPQADALTKVTCNDDLLKDYFSAEGDFEDPLLENGAAYMYLSIPSDYFVDGNQAEMRGDIEDRLDALLRAESSGMLIGGSSGLVKTYIDLLIVDGQKSIDDILNVARDLNLPEYSELCFYDKHLRQESYPV